MTVFAYGNTSKQVGDPEHIKVIASADAAGKTSLRGRLVELWEEARKIAGIQATQEVIRGLSRI